LDNNTIVRRKAQKLIQKGSYGEAAELYSNLAENSALEPHDLVVFADLLSRNGDREGAVRRYIEAMDSYTEAGLNRNAIALGKKVQRLSADFSLAHRKLGDLYASEGLSGESCLHYLEYLEQIDLKDKENGDIVEDVCRRLLDLSLPSFEIIDRIVEIAKSLGHQDSLASGVLHQSQRASALGNTEAHAKLTQMAYALSPDAVPQVAPTEESSDDEGALMVEPDVVDLDVDAPRDTLTVEAQTEEPEVLSLDEFAFDEEEDVAGEEAEVETAEPASEEEAAPVEISDVTESPMEVEGLGDLGKKDFTEPPPVPTAPSGDPDSMSPTSIKEADAVRARGMESFRHKELVRAQMEFMKAAALYFEAGLSREAANLYEQVTSMDPNHLEALTGLVEIAHINGEKAKMAHWGCELGDVLLAREKYPEAKVQFERVLAFDPENPKAESRVKRLNTIAGVREARFGELTAAKGEVEGAKVTVRDDDEAKSKEDSSQSALNLSQILDEFRAAVVDSIPASDSRSHFDLGMTYLEMGLFGEATQEFETAAGNEENRLVSLEMLGECYLQLERYDEAVQALGEFLAGADDESKALAYLKLGRVQEALGLWDQAEENYSNALDMDENLVEAVELLQELEQRREQGAA
jgi:tetratricopeptide (TPR) repeat protein